MSSVRALGRVRTAPLVPLHPAGRHFRFTSVDCWQQKHQVSDENQRRGVEVQPTSLEVVVTEQAASHIFRAFSLCPRSLKHCQRGKKAQHTQGEDEITRSREHVDKHSSGGWTLVAHVLCSLHCCAKFRKYNCLGPFYPSRTCPTGWAGDGSGLQAHHQTPFPKLQGSKPPFLQHPQSNSMAFLIIETSCFSILLCNITR